MSQLPDRPDLDQMREAGQAVTGVLTAEASELVRQPGKGGRHDPIIPSGLPASGSRLAGKVQGPGPPRD